VNLQAAVPVLFGKIAMRPQPVRCQWSPTFRWTIVRANDLITQAKAEIEKAESELRKAKEKPEPPCSHRRCGKEA